MKYGFSLYNAFKFHFFCRLHTLLTIFSPFKWSLARYPTFNNDSVFEVFGSSFVCVFCYEQFYANVLIIESPISLANNRNFLKKCSNNGNFLKNSNKNNRMYIRTQKKWRTFSFPKQLRASNLRWVQQILVLLDLSILSVLSFHFYKRKAFKAETRTIWSKTLNLSVPK